MLGACGACDAGQSAALACDDGIKTAIKPDANTTVLLVKQFNKETPR